MINTMSKINWSKIGWEGGESTSILIISLNIPFFQSTPQIVSYFQGGFLVPMEMKKKTHLKGGDTLKINLVEHSQLIPVQAVQLCLCNPSLYIEKLYQSTNTLLHSIATYNQRPSFMAAKKYNTLSLVILSYTFTKVRP